MIRHFTRQMTAEFMPWNEGGSYVFRDRRENLFLCLDQTQELFAGTRFGGTGDDPCLQPIRSGNRRLFHVFRPLLEQRPALSNYATDLADCYLIQNGGIVAGLNRDEMSEYSTYPALERFLRNTCGIPFGTHFYAWISDVDKIDKGSDQTTEGES